MNAAKALATGIAQRTASRGDALAWTLGQGVGLPCPTSSEGNRPQAHEPAPYPEGVWALMEPQAHGGPIRRPRGEGRGLLRVKPPSQALAEPSWHPRNAVWIGGGRNPAAKGFPHPAWMGVA
ncbi:hypothetical protein [Thermus sediminis]|uniref:hypothetical protein n=1 Tax=Thermus sediminis TaxID=1761908 RepID=UPI000E3CD060|nr:hypothetical protein [Thermus sediminis]